MNAIVQANDDLYAQLAKRLIAEVSAESEAGDHPERDAITAETTYQNLLSVTGKAARFASLRARAGEVARVETDLPLGSDLANLSPATIDAATRFLSEHEMALRAIADASGEGLAWLPDLLTWVKAKTGADEGDGSLPTPGVITNNLWTPGRVFRDIDAPWCPEMVVIPPGEFMMGSPKNEKGRF